MDQRRNSGHHRPDHLGGLARARSVRDPIARRQPASVAALPAGHLLADHFPGECTVKAHRAQVMEKLQVTSLAELVHVAEQFGTSIQRT
jgi:FixJ family two-component response regulator